jgi:hypothetical protein
MPPLIDTPYPPADDLWVVASLKLPQSLQDRMKVIARRRMLSNAAWLRLLIERECDREDAAAGRQKAPEPLKLIKDSGAA